MINVEKVKPTGLFTNYIYKAIPLAFDESMSYYETLCGLLYYLKDTIIPALNNNADAIAEVQELITQLQNYVDNYFENLDVQEEINTKLDEMAESGVLEEIMADYLDTRAVFGFDTVADMKLATNLTNGSFARTLGYSNKNDGEGAIYKIRTITNEDIVNEINIIALADVTLIAELIIEKEEKCFNTVADMKASKSIWNGSYVKTLGYYSANDGGGATYKIVNTQSITEYQEELDSGPYATLIINDYVTPEMFGAYGDGVHDDSLALQKALTSSKPLIIKNKNYVLTEKIENANVPSITGLGGKLLWKSHLTWEDKNYNTKWIYDVKNAIKFSNINNLKIDNFIFKSDKNDDEILTWNGLILEECNDAIITNSEISGFNWCGLSLTSCNNCNINKSKFYENRYGIYDYSNKTIITNNEISGLFSESEEYEINHAWISNSTQDSKYYDGIIEVGANAVISNNLIYDNGQSGIYSSSCSDVTITGNNILNNWNIGIDMGAPSSSTEITRANINNNNLKNNKTHQINLTGINHSNITNNLITINDETNTSYGIIITRADTNYNNISYNKIYISANNSNRGISLDNLTVNNNLIFNDINAPLSHNVTFQSSNLFLEYSSELTEPVARIIKQTGIVISANSSTTIDLSQFNLKDNACYMLNLTGTNSWWNATCLLYTKGPGGGTNNFNLNNSSNLTVSLSGDTLTIQNTNETYSTTLTLTISGNI